MVVRGLASRLRLKHHKYTIVEREMPSRQGAGISSEIETELRAVAYSIDRRRQGAGISSEIETYRLMATHYDLAQSSGGWHLV